jgi:RimJ/RimL family protein N-acetyltransferase
MIELVQKRKDYYIIFKGNKNIGYIYMYSINNGIQLDIIEINKKYRYKGYGTSIVNRLLDKYNSIKVYVDDPIALEFWKRFNPRIDGINVYLTL